jgi:hypothetical protein
MVFINDDAHRVHIVSYRNQDTICDNCVVYIFYEFSRDMAVKTICNKIIGYRWIIVVIFTGLL